jgi:hypothetical protein
MDEKLDIVVTSFDIDALQAEAGLVRVFHLAPERARRFVQEVPTTAKHGQSRGEAERYAEALRAIGARVELRPASAARRQVPNSAGHSLPAPRTRTPSVSNRVSESLRVDRAAEEAIARFRAAEGLDSLPANGGLDPYYPKIPKAPPIPADLERIRNAPPPQLSEPPPWMVTDKQAMAADAFANHRHDPVPLEARRPPPLAGDPDPTSSRPPRYSGPGSHVARAVGLAHAATASIRPGMSGPMPDEPQAPPRRMQVRLFWVFTCAALVLAALRLLHIL